MKTYKLEVDVNGVNVIMACLVKLPYGVVADLIKSLATQVEEQNKLPADTPPAQPPEGQAVN